MTYRTVQADGLTLFYIRYWHPIFTAWRATKQKVITRFHPEDLSKIFVSVDGKRYLEATFADLRRERISLWEQRSALRHLRAQGQKYVSEAMLFEAIDEDRCARKNAIIGHKPSRHCLEGSGAKERSAREFSSSAKRKRIGETY